MIRWTGTDYAIIREMAAWWQRMRRYAPEGGGSNQFGFFGGPAAESFFGGGARAQMLVRVTGMADDYVSAKLWDGTTEIGTALKVAKPWDLQMAAHHGESYVIRGTTYTYTYTTGGGTLDPTRVSDDGSTEETQLITPSYYVGAVLRIEKVGYTGVDVAGESLVWEDLNRAGRAWMKE